MTPFLRLLAAGAVAIVLAPEGLAGADSARAGSIRVDFPWTRAAAPGRPMAGYMTITNGAERGDALVGASSPAFDAVEIHVSEETDGVMTMRRLDEVALPSAGRTALEPGGTHLMLIGPRESFAEGDSVPVTLSFRAAGELEIALAVQSPTARSGGGPAPNAPGHGTGGHAGHGSAD